MSTSANDFRMWVLGHWRQGGWSIAAGRLRTKKGTAAIERLIRDRLMDRDDCGLYRATEEGMRAFEAWDPLRRDNQFSAQSKFNREA